MATSVNPENQQGQIGEGQNPTDNPQNPPSNTNPPIDTKNLLAELMEMSRSGPANPPTPPVNTTPAQVPDPVLNTAEYINYALQQHVAPLNEFVADMRRKEKYNEIKNRLRINPQFAAIFTQIEPFLDQKIFALPHSVPISEELVAEYFLSTIGRVALMAAGNGNGQGQIPNNQNNQPNNVNGTNPGTVLPQGGNVGGNPTNINNPGNGGGNQRLITPPHVAPRNPAPSLSGGVDYNTLLTEDEKAWAASKGLTLEEAHRLKTVPPDQVNEVYREIKARMAKENK